MDGGNVHHGTALHLEEHATILGRLTAGRTWHHVGLWKSGMERVLRENEMKLKTQANQAALHETGRTVPFERPETQSHVV